MQGYDIVFQSSSTRTIPLAPRPSPHYLNVSPACSHLVHVRSGSMHHGINYHPLYRIHNGFKRTSLSPYSLALGEGYCLPNRRHAKKVSFRVRASLDVATAVDVINDLGSDTLTFLAVTVLVVPAFKKIKASPVSCFYQIEILRLLWNYLSSLVM